MTDFSSPLFGGWLLKNLPYIKTQSRATEPWSRLKRTKPAQKTRVLHTNTHTHTEFHFMVGLLPFPFLWKHVRPRYTLSWTSTVWLPRLSLPQCQDKPVRLHFYQPIIVPSTKHYICGCYVWLLCCIIKCCLWLVNSKKKKKKLQSHMNRLSHQNVASATFSNDFYPLMSLDDQLFA